MQNNKKKKSPSPKIPRWNPTGPDAALAARLVNNGGLNESPEQYARFLEDNPDIAHKCAVHLPKGAHNLRKNVLKLIKRVFDYNATRRDRESNNRK